MDRPEEEMEWGRPPSEQVCGRIPKFPKSRSTREGLSCVGALAVLEEIKN
jgi:hypothetical protein